MKMYIARNETGELWLFGERPYLKESKDGDKHWWVDGTDFYYSSVILDCDSHPEVTFENSPMEVELKLIEK